MVTTMSVVRSSLFAACLALLSFAGSASAAQEGSRLHQLRTLDARVATIGHRLAVANLDLCRDRQWLPGFSVQDLSQYGVAERPGAIRAFGLGDGPAVLAVAAGGPAERAGLRADDLLLAADGAALRPAPPGPTASYAQVEQLLAALDQAFADGSATIGIRRRGGGAAQVSVRAEQGCASRFQLIPSRRLNALADGRYVQVTSAIAAYVASEDELAAVLAHEFAHNVLRHRARLDQAGVARGFRGNFGRNARLIRETEVEADRLSVYLLDRAGYDPAAAASFWSRFGRRGLNFLDFFGSPTHPDWRRRIRLLEAETAQIRQAQASGRTPTPPFLAPGDAAPPDR